MKNSNNNTNGKIKVENEKTLTPFEKRAIKFQKQEMKRLTKIFLKN